MYIDFAGQRVGCVEDDVRRTVMKSDYFGSGILPSNGAVFQRNCCGLEEKTAEVSA